MQRNFIDLMKNQGFGDTGKYKDSNSYEGQKAFTNAVTTAETIWKEQKLADDAKLTKDQFTQYTQAFIEKQKYNYLQGMTSDHLSQLFDIYTNHLTTDNKTMDNIQFCHAFTFLCRQNLDHETSEITLAKTIELIHAAIKTNPISNSLCLAKPKIQEEFKKSDKPYVLYINEGRAQIANQHLVTHGLNLIVAFHDKAKRLQHVPLISVLNSSLILHPALELNHLSELVDNLQKEVPDHLISFNMYLPKLAQNLQSAQAHEFNHASGVDVAPLIQEWTKLPSGVSAIVMSYYYSDYMFSYLNSIVQHGQLTRPMKPLAYPVPQEAPPAPFEFKLDFSALKGLSNFSLFPNQPAKESTWTLDFNFSNNTTQNQQPVASTMPTLNFNFGNSEEDITKALDNLKLNFPSAPGKP